MRVMPRARMASAVFLLVALVIVAGTAGVATGLPLPPLFPALPPVAGESHLTSYIVGPASSISVDWMVLPAAMVGAPLPPFGGGPAVAAPPGSFVYYYQVENSSASALDTFTITMPTASVLFGGILPLDNLDLVTGFHPAHGVPPSPFLPLETVELPLVPAVVLGFTVTPTDVTITTFPYLPGGQTETAYFVSTLPPTYGVAGILDTSPPSPWGSLAPGGDLVPIPISEPGILFPVGVALTALGLVASRRTRQK